MPAAVRFAVRFAVGIAAVLLLSACRAPAPVGPAPTAVAPLTIRLAALGADAWRASYAAGGPIERLEFVRESALVRSERWRLVTPGYRFVRDGARERIELVPGAAARHAVELELATDDAQLYKDYEAFVRFSDGGVLVYTGHLAATLPGPTPSPRAWRFAPAAGSRVVVGGRVVDGEAEWRDAEGDGTFVYFGRVAPRVDANLVAVLDPGLPPWLVRRLDEMLPRLFADYAALSGRALATRPVVYFSFKPATKPGFSSWKGGVVPGVIQLAMEQAADAPEDAAQLAEFVKFLAHEAAHLWNGDLFRNETRHASWLHEGGADAFALRALHRLGLIDAAGLRERQVEALNECLRVLDARALDAAEAQGDFAPVYPCGATLAWFGELALAAGGSRDDLMALWRRVFDAAAARDGRYGEPLYLETLAAAGAPADAVAFVEAFVHREMPERRAELARAFAAVGAPLREAPPPRAWTDQALKDGLMALMAGDCNGAVSLSFETGGFRIHGLARCRTLKQDLAVRRIGGHALGAAPREARAALAAACGAGRAVRLDGGAGTAAVEVACRTPLAATPAWLDLAR